MGSLYIVPTPLGNLEDMTLRALRVLKEVALIATEDTRTTGKLLAHFGISCPMLSYFEHSKPAQLERVLAALAEGDVALVSEAGTPLLSDPGYQLVVAAVAQGITVIPLPGPCAPIVALSASGLPTDRFLFAGFLPRKAGERRRALAELVDQPATLLFFEAPHRVREALADLAEVLGAQRQVAVCRELTKLHEEIWRGTLAGALAEWIAREPRGEFTLVVAGAEAAEAVWTEAEVSAALAAALAAGATRKEAIRQVTAQSGWPKRQVYALGEAVKSA
jgi:16S rRNA (cytidine1402-2'-O)-methyltransferase